MKKFMLLMLPLLVFAMVSCSEGTDKTDDGKNPVVPPKPTIPPVIATNVKWADIAFPEGVSTIADPDTGLATPTGTPTVADKVIYDNNSEKHKVSIIVKESAVGKVTISGGEFDGPVPFQSTLSDDNPWDNASFVTHYAIPSSALLAISTVVSSIGFGVNENNSATWVLKDNGTVKSGYFVSINHLGKNSKVYKALQADDKYTYRLDISTEDPFAKGEILSSEELTYADAIAKLPNTIKPTKPDFITAEQKVTLVTFKNPKKGYEIRVSDIDDYTKFRTYLDTQRKTGGQYEDISHPKSSAPSFMGGFDYSFDLAVPEATKLTDTTTAAWAFVDGVNYVSFIYHSPKSPSNPLPDDTKNIFIIEVMQDDPMWFMPLKDDNAQ